MSIEFHPLKTYDEFLKLREPWNELVKACEVDHAFMRHEWFTCWLRNLGDPGKMALCTGWQDGQLAAIAPLRIVSQKVGGMPVRTLAFMTSAIAPRCNFIVHPSVLSSELFEEVFRQRGWDLMSLQGLEAGQTVTLELVEFLNQRHGKRVIIETGRQSPYLMVEGDWNEYLQNLSKKHRKNINQGLNRLARLESYEFRKIDNFAEIKDIFDQVVSISDKSWKKAGGSSLSVQQQQRSFYLDFCETGSSEGLWEMRLLSAGKEHIAFNFFLKHGNRLVGIRTDFDEEYKYYGPGQMMIYFTLMELFAGGEKWEFDMGGMAADFKLDWTEKTRDHYIISVLSTSLYGSLLRFGRDKVLPLIKSWRNRKAPLGAS